MTSTRVRGSAADPVAAGDPGSSQRPPGLNPHLCGVFEPVIDEVDVGDLTVVGELPADLDGVYLRNGPNPRFSPLGAYLYPLDGDGMAHSIRISEGRACYSNRFVRTPAVVAEEQVGRALWGGLAGPRPTVAEVGSALAGTRRDMPDVNIVRHSGRLLALAESANPYRLGPDLDTLGRETFGGDLPVGITAHPKIDPVTGEMAVFCYQLERPYLTWSMIDRYGVVTRTATTIFGVDRPVMVHDMALTRKYLVLVLAPLFFTMDAVSRGGSPLSWEPDQGVRVALIPRDGGPVQWARTDSFWMWHTANAFDRNVNGSDEVVLDYVQWATPGMGAAPGPPLQRKPGSATGPAGGGGRRSASTGELARAVIDVTTGHLTRDVFDDVPVEFPRIDDRSIGRAHHTIAVGARTGWQELPAGAYDAIRWYQPGTGATHEWSRGNTVLGEPVFIPKPGDRDPNHGWWATITVDLETRVSQFVIIPAADPSTGPVATVLLPVRVPLGLHGNWLPSEE